MKRNLFPDEFDTLRTTVRAWIADAIVPNQERWRETGEVDREVWREAGAMGLLCPWLPERYGGSGGNFLHSVVFIEELAHVYETGFFASLHSDVVVPYLHDYGSDTLKVQWLPGCADGSVITAVAMTEPDAGSDLSALRTRAERDGEDYLITGSKTFISNGLSADLVVVAARTGDAQTHPHQSLSLFAVDAQSPGFSRGRRLKKLGLPAQDTAELHFDHVRVPQSARLGAEGQGFAILAQKLQQERLVVAISCQATAEQVLEDTIAWCKERKAFGRPISKLQNTRFELASCASEIEAGRWFIDRLIEAHLQGDDVVKEVSMAKQWHSDMLQRIADRCLQLFGGYGYMMEYPIAHAFADARVQRIYAGTNEIMKVIVAQKLGL